MTSACRWANRDGMAIREGRWKLHRLNTGRLELYDLDQDRRESANLAGAQPDVASRLARDLLDWRAGW